ncbi:MAG: SDR family NAD(P)-dependent oxidoreductase [Xanthobacteraceae bacterium]|nr:SDR family NAD(P)-dependent oxidoreductase [Xanthobacteraceae bacterium]
MEFKDKVAVITGGASGIGLATARALARSGARLVLADIEKAALDQAVAALQRDGFEAIGVRTDVGDRGSVAALADAAWERFGAVHILFNNAGVAVFGPTQEMSHADWEWTLRVNLWGPIHGIECFAPRMIAGKQGGHILFTASFAGLVSNRALGPYSVSKAAVVSLAECLAKDLKPHGIGVSVLCPMRVATHINDSERNRPADMAASTATAYEEAKNTPQEGRILDAEAVADLVAAGIRRNELYIITHKESGVFIERRFERLKAAMAGAI